MSIIAKFVCQQDVGNVGFERAFEQALRSVRAFLEIHKVFFISNILYFSFHLSNIHIYILKEIA